MNHPTEDEPILRTVAEPLQQVLRQAAALAKKEVDKPKSHTLPYRPTNRQPMAMLTIINDDSREAGETIYIRSSQLVMGRDQGDITIPFDPDISGQHAELRCKKFKGRYRWYLIDLASTNGTFLRGYQASLSKETELMLGSRRYSFTMPEHYDDQDTQAIGQTQAFRPPARNVREKFLPRLIELGRGEEDCVAFPVEGSQVFIGSDSQCQIPIEDDPFLSPKHAKIYQDERSRWMIDDQKSLNGVWIRIKRMALDQTAEFQLGQQRFRFEPSKT